MSDINPPFVPDLVLEQFRLGELPERDADRVRWLLRTDPSVQMRMEALAESDERIAARYSSAALAGAIRRRLADGAIDPSRSRIAFRWSFPVATAAIALVLIATIPREPARSATDPAPRAAPTERIKGLRPSLVVYRHTTHGSETLADGAVARTGDLLRLGYSALDRPFGTILSIDGRGTVTVHLPPDGHTAAPLVRGDRTLLDTAYELDDAPRWERFYFVTARTSFGVDAIVAAARRAAAQRRAEPPAALDLPREFEQATFLLLKEVMP